MVDVKRKSRLSEMGRLRIAVLFPLFCSCSTIPPPRSVAWVGSWALAEHQGLLAWVRIEDPSAESVPLTARVWVEDRPDRGPIAVAEVRVLDPERGIRYRIEAEPLGPNVTLISPDCMTSEGVARFEFVGPVPGSAALRLRASRRPDR